MFSKKNVLISLVLIIVLLLVAACGAATPETIIQTVEVEKEVKVIETVEVEKEVVKEVEKIVEVTAVPEEKEPVELRIAWWGNETRHTRTIQVIKEFEEQYPWIKVTYEFATWDDHWTRLATQAAGGNLPDLMQHDYARLKEWVNNGLLLPLDEYAASGVLDFSNVADATLEGGRVDGKLYGVNLGTNSLCFVVDTDAFEKAGVALPANDWTWADFEEIAVALNDKLGIWGYGGNSLAHDQMWRAVIMSNGEWVYADDGKSLGYNDDQVLIDHMKMILRLQEAGVIESRDVEVARATLGLEADPLVTGESAMGFMWSNQLASVWNAAGAERHFKLVTVPRLEGGLPAIYVKPSMFFSITSQAKHPEEAAMFIDFFINSVAANHVLLAERGVPVSSVIQESLQSVLTPDQVEMFAYMAMVPGDSQPVPPPDPVGEADVRNNVYYPEFVDPVLYGTVSPEEGVATFRKMANEVLAAK
jgi:multiple sugar transport system substrate-binding protein